MSNLMCGLMAMQSSISGAKFLEIRKGAVRC